MLYWCDQALTPVMTNWSDVVVVWPGLNTSHDKLMNCCADMHMPQYLSYITLIMIMICVFVCDEMSVSLCLYKHARLLQDGVLYIIYYYYYNQKMCWVCAGVDTWVVAYQSKDACGVCMCWYLSYVIPVKGCVWHVHVLIPEFCHTSQRMCVVCAGLCTTTAQGGHRWSGRCRREPSRGQPLRGWSTLLITNSSTRRGRLTSEFTHRTAKWLNSFRPHHHGLVLYTVLWPCSDGLWFLCSGEPLLKMILKIKQKGSWKRAGLWFLCAVEPISKTTLKIKQKGSWQGSCPWSVLFILRGSLRERFLKEMIWREEWPFINGSSLSGKQGWKSH